MRNLILIAIVTYLVVACTNQKSTENLYQIPSVTYPVTKKVNVVDNYFGTKVSDPYRWLENDTAKDVAEWVKQENEVTQKFLSAIPFRDKIKSRLEEVYNYARVSSPFKAGEYYFYFKNSGTQNQSVLYKKKGMNGTEEVFIDPNSLSADGTVSIEVAGISKDKKYIAYSVAAAGSDWSQILVKDVETGKNEPDTIKWVKFSGASWFGKGFFYSRFPEPVKGMELTQSNSDQTIYYHQLGDKQGNDKLIYEDKSHPKYYNSVSLSDDGKYMFLYIASGTDGFECYYKPTDLKKGGFIPLFTGFEHKSSVVDHHNGLFYVYTDIDAPKYHLIALDPKNPDKKNWKEIIPETNDMMQYVVSAGGKLFVQYMKDVISHLYQFDFSGKQEKEIEFPAAGDIGLSYWENDEPEIFYSFESFTYPRMVYSYNINTGVQTVFFKPELKFNPADYEVKQVFYKSKDSTIVPMFIVSKKGLKMDGNNPTLLYGYGGFDISMSPFFSSNILALMENNVIYAMPNLRGGNEYGEDWHRAGMLQNKQHVFDDFIAAAEYLINEKYTSKEKLGIMGGSNGGLLVGACMTQRPDLYKVALPAVGVMDMLRYQKFTVGFGWVPEYGSSDDSASFVNLYKYSPLQNLKPGLEYPATLITTGDHDDRVVPAHSFKFAATLQEDQKGPNPVLIRIETKAGHGAGKPISKVIEETADKWAFFLFNTQSPVVYK